MLLADVGPENISQSLRQVLDLLLSNADNLQAMIQHLLKYNAVAHGLMRTENQLCMHTLCQRIRQKLPDTRPGTLRQWLIEGSDNMITTDQPVINMILSNLMSNAYDYTSNKGEIAVCWGQGHNTWWLKVADNGPGMSSDEVSSVYRPFYQGKAKKSGPLKGSGMGLAIVHECVSQLNGKISITSELNLSLIQISEPTTPY
mgnify:CR=1 FL=1